MNPQLDYHLESFDSDGEYEYSESPELHEEEHVAPVLQDVFRPMDKVVILKVQFWLRKFVKPTKSLKDGVTKLVWLLPVAIVLGDYIGLMFSLNLSVIFLIVLQLKPDDDHPHDDGDPIQSLLEHFWKLDMDAEKLAKKKKHVQDCRKEVSRLLGLIGAPPLDWPSLETNKIAAIKITGTATMTVVKFLEAHVQYLLTVDQAFHSLRKSASLHLGLGAQSQCVERVERAAIAREYRNNQRRKQKSISASLINEGGVLSLLEPQRGVDKSILALTSARNHLAKNMVAQSDSLIQVWKGVHNATGGPPLPRTDFLNMPDVVDLTWIKSARHQIASLLTHILDYFCTIDCLHTLSEGHGIISRLNESMWNTRNAREHVLCNLLLGKKPVVKSLPDPNDRLMLSLVQYRDQLDALGGAIWACQQYIDNLPTEDSKVLARRHWWSQVKQLGATCRALENEISEQFFPSTSDDIGTEDISDVGENRDQDQSSMTPNESGNYEHGHVGTEIPSEKKEDDKPTKTMVFRGQGSISDRPEKEKKRATNGGGGSGGSGGGLPLPVRDSVSTRLLVKELQNRIDAIKPDDDEDDVDIDSEKAAKAARAPTAPTASHFLGASGSLLSELKLSIPATEQSEEQILEE